MEILKDLLLEKQLTQTEFARLTGVKQGQVSEWLKGKAKPGYDNLKSICVNLGISGDFILGISDSEKAPCQRRSTK